MFKQCPVCQQQVPVYEWAVHEMQHRGQPPKPPLRQAHSGPASLPLQQAVAKAPRIYHHPRCGHATALPEAAVYAQIQDPFCGGDLAYCSGCKGYINTSELFWEGTSESLLSSDRRQKAEYIRSHALDPGDFVWDATGPVRRKSKSNWGMIVGVGIGGMALLFLLGVGLVITLVVYSHRSAAARRAQFAPRVQPPFVQQEAAFPRPPMPEPVGMNPFVPAEGFDEVLVRREDPFAEMRKHQEELRKQMEAMRPPEISPPTLEPPGGLGGFPAGLPGGEDPGAESRRQIEKLQEDTRRRIEEMRAKSRQRHEEAMQRMKQRTSRLP